MGRPKIGPNEINVLRVVRNRNKCGGSIGGPSRRVHLRSSARKRQQPDEPEFGVGEEITTTEHMVTSYVYY
jgi:hypothetical protein